MCTRGFLQRRHVAPATPCVNSCFETMKRRPQLPLDVRTRRAVVCAHTAHTHMSRRMSDDVGIEMGGWRAHSRRGGVGEYASESAASRSPNPRCPVTASVLAPHVATLYAAQLRSASTTTAASWPGTRAPHVSVFLSCERWCATAHAARGLRQVGMLHEVLPWRGCYTTCRHSSVLCLQCVSNKFLHARSAGTVANSPPAVCGSKRRGYA